MNNQMQVGKFMLVVPHIWLCGRYEQIPLPTEVVIGAPEFVVPNMGRWYETNLYQRNGTAVSYDQLRSLPDFEGTSREIHLYLCECYADWGADGHIAYRLQGWTLFTSGRLFYANDQESLDYHIRLLEGEQVYSFENNRCVPVTSIS